MKQIRNNNEVTFAVCADQDEGIMRVNRVFAERAKVLSSQEAAMLNIFLHEYPDLKMVLV